MNLTATGGALGGPRFVCYGSKNATTTVGVLSRRGCGEHLAQPQLQNVRRQQPRVEQLALLRLVKVRVRVRVRARVKVRISSRVSA